MLSMAKLDLSWKLHDINLKSCNVEAQLWPITTGPSKEELWGIMWAKGSLDVLIFTAYLCYLR